MKIRFTCLLIVTLIAVFAAEVALPQLVEELALSGEALASRPWTALTAIFSHADLEHLVANLVVLLFFGLAVEKELGWKKTLGLFLAGAFAGEAVSLLAYPPDMLSLGASGGVFALVGAAMLVHPFLELGAWPGVATLPLVFLAALYVAYNALGIFFGPADIAYGAHFAGLAVGIAVGFVRRRTQSK